MLDTKTSLPHCSAVACAHGLLPDHPLFTSPLHPELRQRMFQAAAAPEYHVRWAQQDAAGAPAAPINAPRSGAAAAAADVATLRGLAPIAGTRTWQFVNIAPAQASISFAGASLLVAFFGFVVKQKNEKKRISSP